jgi:hypothetical protein
LRSREGERRAAVRHPRRKEKYVSCFGPGRIQVVGPDKDDDLRPSQVAAPHGLFAGRGRECGSRHDPRKRVVMTRAVLVWRLTPIPRTHVNGSPKGPCETHQKRHVPFAGPSAHSPFRRDAAGCKGSFAACRALAASPSAPVIRGAQTAPEKAAATERAAGSKLGDIALMTCALGDASWPRAANPNGILAT